MSRIPTISSYSMGSSRDNVNSCVVWSHYQLATGQHTCNALEYIDIKLLNQKIGLFLICNGQSPPTSLTV